MLFIRFQRSGFAGLFEPFGHFVDEVFLHDSPQERVSHLPNDDVLVALLVELALQFVPQPGIEVLNRSLTGIERALFGSLVAERSIGYRVPRLDRVLSRGLLRRLWFGRLIRIVLFIVRFIFKPLSEGSCLVEDIE